jgi:hypothetical protein
MTEDEQRRMIDRKIATAHHTALRMNDDPLIRVSVHVSPTVWEYLRAKAMRRVDNDSALVQKYLPEPVYGKLFGFDVFRETAFEDTRIEVRATSVML